MKIAKAYISIGAVSLLAVSTPACAQLSPVYGSLRTALENSMAQSVPPYGKPDRPAQSASRSVSPEETTSAPRRGPDTAMNDMGQPPRGTDQSAP